MDSDAIKALIGELLLKLTIEFERIEVIEDALHTVPQFHIFTKDSRLLIGNHGSGLSALNHLMRHMIHQRTKEGERAPQFLIDVNNYRTRRMEELIYKANVVAERAKLFRHEVEMLPMPPYERMIVHAHFAQHPDITTESHGEGKFRRVVIKYEEKKSLNSSPLES